MKKLVFGFFIPALLIVVFMGLPALAENVSHSELSHAETKAFEQGEIAQVLAPIALYPDSLLTHILIASTYPIEVIEAHRWATKNPDITGEDAEKQVEAFEWDPSVVALISFPSVLEKMSTELGWTQQLGDAFLQDEERVLATIQTLREQAQHAGNLEKMENVKVIKEKETIIIEPAKKEVVYVPYYDTRVVYGGWHWAHHPPVYWHYPHHHVVHHHHSPFHWHTGVHISFNFFFSSFHWSNRHVVVHHHHRKPYYHKRHYGYKRSVSHSGYANSKRWHHNPVHRRGAAYKSSTISRKYHSNRPSKSYTKTVRVSEKQFGKHPNKVKTTTITRHQKLNKKMTTTKVTKTKSTHYKNSKPYSTKSTKQKVTTHANKTKTYRSEKYQHKPVKNVHQKQVKSVKQSTRTSKHYQSKPSSSVKKSKQYSSKQTKQRASKNSHRSKVNVKHRSSKGGSSRHH